MFKANVITVGRNSIGITIPKPIAEALGIKPKDKLIVEIRKVK